MHTDRERLIALNLIPGIGSTRLRRLLDAFGSLDRLWHAGPEALQQVEGIGPALARQLVESRENAGLVQQELALAARQGSAILTLEDPGYPEALRAISDPPLALYVQGTLQPEDRIAVALVGARRASRYGLECAERLAYDLALHGVTVVSGLARGIDAAAHHGVLKVPGRTLAVLGSGLARVYPPEHAALAARVAAHGAVMSEYPMQMPPLAQNFPRRNRIVSGLSLGVVVVEAGARSGALISADCALEQGREVMAVPGPVTSVTFRGSHRLLRQGARLVESVDDILEELRLAPQPAPRAEESAGGAAGLPETERRVLACLSAEQPREIDAVAFEAGLAMPEASALLLQLELRQLIRQLPGKRFVRRARE